ncbi:hypothetical protein MSKU15_0669 [Komagataeibacter diospyri]|nr:hypothetical protein [Komagataeibacter diospyri]GCE89068.1 hypothetical protein MSKU15_0669 [Komagataeibacter diospyri]
MTERIVYLPSRASGGALLFHLLSRLYEPSTDDIRDFLAPSERREVARAAV